MKPGTFPPIPQFLLVMFLALMVGCASFVKPETLESKLMYAQAQVGGAYNTVAALRKRDAISKDEGKAAIVEIDKADQGIKLARGALGQGDISTAEGQLNAALTALVAIEAALKAKQ
jgi:predicted transcriptional regulator